MKILVLTTSFPRYRGDFAGRRIYDLVKTLSSKYEMHVIYIMYPSAIKDIHRTSEHFHCHMIRYPYKTYSLAENSGFFKSLCYIPLFLNMLTEMRRVAKNYKIDLIHAHWVIPSGFLASLGCGKIPVVTTLRGSDIKKFGKQRMFKYPIIYALKRSTKIVALSNDLKQDAIDLGTKSDKIYVIPGGVDVNKFRPQDRTVARLELHLSEEGFLIIFVGRLIKAKRVDKLINMSVKLSQDFDFHLVIVGDGPERANLENLAKGLGLKNVLFTESVSHDSVPSYMAASDLLVLPSESEGLPGCVQEAMACGTPVVASNVGGLADLITNGVNGYLVDTEAEMEERMRLLMSSPELVQTMGANALEFARQNLSLDMVVKKTEELYASILKQKP